MDHHSLKVLEFDKIGEFLSSFASSPGGKQACTTLIPATTTETIEALLTETTEMKREIEVHGPLPLRGIHDIRKAVARSRIQQFYLEPADLLCVKDLLETADAIRKYFSAVQDTCPQIFLVTRGIIPLNHLADRISRSISAQGEILDSASPQLADLRSRIAKIRLTIIKTLEGLLTNEAIDHAFQDDFITLRNNRYVVPVRSDSKSMIPGVVHDQSQTKATFFVEPLSIVNQNNELQILRKDEYYEVIRILTDITGSISGHGDDILSNLQILERIDVIHARALFSKALGAVEPHINSEGVIELHDCRHPILLSRFVEEPPSEDREPPAADVSPGRWEFDRGGVVPIDIIKHTTTSAIIITGANAGGKTVALKTLGLLVLMTQAGMHLPTAQRSTLCIFDQVFADIGDEQSLATSLSTFSAHMDRIKHIVAHVSRLSLVLLDELGAGTDPTEGGALAAALLDYLRACGCSTVITTHLNILKTYAYTNTDVENISVAFDPVTLKPLYRLVYGVPGMSNALAIARQIGIPEQILKNAGRYLDASGKQITELIHGLETSHAALLEEKTRLAQIRRHAQTYQDMLENLLETMKTRKEKILKHFESSARSLLRECEQQLMKLIKEQKRTRIVRPEDAPAHAQRAREAFAKVQHTLAQQFPRTDNDGEAVQHLEVGQTVRIRHLAKDGLVVAVDNKARKAEIAVGTVRIKAGFGELRDVPPPQPESHLSEACRPAEPVSAPRPASAGPQKINVIGMRVAEALPEVDKAIDHAVLQGADTLEIIHGKGTGRLMQAIHEHLESHPSVSRFQSGDALRGGAGITIVTIS